MTELEQAYRNLENVIGDNSYHDTDDELDCTIVSLDNEYDADELYEIADLLVRMTITTAVFSLIRSACLLRVISRNLARCYSYTVTRSQRLLRTRRRNLNPMKWTQQNPFFEHNPVTVAGVILLILIATMVVARAC